MLRKKHLLLFVVLTVVANSWLAPLFAPSGNEEAPEQGLPKPPQTSLTQTPSSTTAVASAANHPQSFQPILLYATLQGTSDLAPKKKYFPLFSLPEELWQLILDFAYEDAFDEGTVTQEWKNLRLTCKTINQHVTNEAFFKYASSYLSDINYIKRFVAPGPLKPLVDVFLTNVTLSMDITEILLNPAPRTLTKQVLTSMGRVSVPYTAEDIAAAATLKKAVRARPEQFTLDVLNPTDQQITGLASVPCPLDVAFRFGEMPNFALLSNLKSLKKLTLENSDVITSLGDLSQLTALVTLKLIVPEPIFWQPAHHYFLMEPGLQADIPPAPQTLKAMGIPPNLKWIALQRCRGLTNISHLLNLPKLQNIFIHDCPLVPPAQVTAFKAHIASRNAMASNS